MITKGYGLLWDTPVMEGLGEIWPNPSLSEPIMFLRRPEPIIEDLGDKVETSNE